MEKPVCHILICSSVLHSGMLNTSVPNIWWFLPSSTRCGGPMLSKSQALTVDAAACLVFMWHPLGNKYAVCWPTYLYNTCAWEVYPMAYGRGIIKKHATYVVPTTVPCTVMRWFFQNVRSMNHEQLISKWHWTSCKSWTKTYTTWNERKRGFIEIPGYSRSSHDVWDFCLPTEYFYTQFPPA